MKSQTSLPKTIDEYIAGFPPSVRKVLQQVRATIHEAAPAAEEAIKYQIPTFVLDGNLIHFAAYQKHIGVYPAPAGVDRVKKELAHYRSGKGTFQFPLDRPIPLDLIREVVKFRLRETTEKAKAAKG